MTATVKQRRTSAGLDATPTHINGHNGHNGRTDSPRFDRYCSRGALNLFEVGPTRASPGRVRRSSVAWFCFCGFFYSVNLPLVYGQYDFLNSRGSAGEQFITLQVGLRRPAWGRPRAAGPCDHPFPSLHLHFSSSNKPVDDAFRQSQLTSRGWYRVENFSLC